jgi:hypothetical protein
LELVCCYSNSLWKIVKVAISNEEVPSLTPAIFALLFAT